MAAASPEAAALIVQEAAAAAAAATTTTAADGDGLVELGRVRGPTGGISPTAEVLSTEQGDELYCAPLEDMMAWGEST